MSKKISAIDIAKTLIEIDTSDEAGIVKALDWISTWAKESNLRVKSFPKTKALLVETNPGAPFHFNFVTHIDVVPADGWKEAFKPQVKHDLLFGRGAVDDKGPLAICLSLLAEHVTKKDINISCLIVTDEETTNEEIKEIINSGDFKPNFSLVADGGTHNLIDIGQKGIIRCELLVKTKGGHSAFEEKASSASLQLLSILQQLMSIAAVQPHTSPFSPTFINVSSLVSQSLPYGLPSEARAAIEIQFPLPQQSSFWLQELEKIKQEKPNVEVSVKWVSEPHLFEDKAILHIFSELGLSAITTGGNNLAKDLCLGGIPAVSHCPVEEYMAHCDNEYIHIQDFEIGKKTYEKIIAVCQTMAVEEAL